MDAGATDPELQTLIIATELSALANCEGDDDWISILGDANDH